MWRKGRWLWERGRMLGEKKTKIENKIDSI
jgi:hypothetical protein